MSPALFLLFLNTNVSAESIVAGAHVVGALSVLATVCWIERQNRK